MSAGRVTDAPGGILRAFDASVSLLIRVCTVCRAMLSIDIIPAPAVADQRISPVELLCDAPHDPVAALDYQAGIFPLDATQHKLRAEQFIL